MGLCGQKALKALVWVQLPCCLFFSLTDAAHTNGGLDAAAPASRPAPHIRMPDGSPEGRGFPSPSGGIAFCRPSWRPKPQHSQRTQLWFSKYEVPLSFLGVGRESGLSASWVLESPVEGVGGRWLDHCWTPQCSCPRRPEPFQTVRQSWPHLKKESFYILSSPGPGEPSFCKGF